MRRAGCVRHLHRWGTSGLVGILLLAGLGFSSAAHAEKYKIATIGQGEHFALMATQILKRAYERAGHDLEIVFLPGRRSLVESNSGRFDGELIRLPVIEKDYPNLVRVDAPLLNISLYAFSHSPAVAEITSWQDLNKYRIVMRRGVKILEANVKAPNVILVDSSDQLFNILERGRADLVITNSRTAILYARTGIQRSPALYDQAGYHYIHKSHPELVKQIGASLRELKEAGITDRIIYEMENAPSS